MPVGDEVPYRGDAIAELRRERDQAYSDRDAMLQRLQIVTEGSARWKERARTMETFLVIICTAFVFAVLLFLFVFRAYVVNNRRADLCGQTLRNYDADAGLPEADGK